MSASLRTFGAVFLALLITLAPVRADDVTDCLQGEGLRRIDGCSRVIEQPGLPRDDLSLAYSLRALAYSLRGDYDVALADYDKAIELKPDFGVALNNRAWAYFKSGRAAHGESDVERALEIDPTSAYALDTRAHIRQTLGRPQAALSDYTAAMRYGGSEIIKLYQCGLRAYGYYSGSIDGEPSAELNRALVACIATEGCDPLPADEECRAVVS